MGFLISIWTERFGAGLADMIAQGASLHDPFLAITAAYPRLLNSKSLKPQTQKKGADWRQWIRNHDGGKGGNMVVESRLILG